MQKGLMVFAITFILFGMLLSGGFVFAQTDSTTDNSGSSSDSGTDNSGSSDDRATKVDSDDSDKKEDTKDETDKDDERDDDKDDDKKDRDKAREKIREKIEKEKDRSREKFESDVRLADGSRVRVERFVEVDGDEVKIKIRRRVTDANGVETDRTIVVERDSDDFKAKIKIEGIDGLEVETELEIDDELVGDETELGVLTSDGETTEINILPDQAREIALERLKTRIITKIELDEVRHRNEIRAAYRLEAEKDGRFLGLFKLKLKLDSVVDPETGEVLDTEKPWWAFLVSGEDDLDDDLKEGELEIKAETLGGSSEVKVELEFSTEKTDTSEIITELLDRLNLDSETVGSLLEMEVSDEALEDKDKLEVEIDSKDDFKEVEFELEFLVESDVREMIVDAIVVELDGLTEEGLTSAVELDDDSDDSDDLGVDADEEDFWKSDGIELWSTESGHDCFGCNNEVCQDPPFPQAGTEMIEETEDRYCNADFEVVVK